ncbi:MAG: histidine kinase [Prevotella sp.]|nr:histidine kinase [Prevotella sp.]
MKFDIKKATIPAIHILFCVIILVIPLLVMSRSGMSENWHYGGYLLRTGSLVLLFYVNYFFLIDKLLFKRQFVLYILINILLIIGVSLLQNLLFELLLGPPPIKTRGLGPGPEGFKPPHELRILSDYALIILAVGMSVALKATMRWYKDSINLESIKATQLEADLKNLRSQLNPHFLFNTLNNIYSLIAIDTNKAQESVHRLSNLLRYILYENEDKFVPIDRELKFTQNYIDLMRLRLSPGVKLDVLIKDDDCDEQIASLLFITLIENAFKHGINNGSESFIDIKILINKKNGILCTVENSLAETENNMESKNSGIGLTNLRKRLELLYPKSHELKIEQREHSFFVSLHIYFDKDKKIEQ